jgi:hypothetical protein
MPSFLKTSTGQGRRADFLWSVCSCANAKRGRNRQPSYVGHSVVDENRRFHSQPESVLLSGRQGRALLARRILRTETQTPPQNISRKARCPASSPLPDGAPTAIPAASPAAIPARIWSAAFSLRGDREMAIGASTSRTRNRRKATPETGDVSMTASDYIVLPPPTCC